MSTVSFGGGNWDDANTWVEIAVPTAADEVIVTGLSGNLTVNVSNAVCRSINLTDYTGVLTFNASSFLSIGDGTAGTGNVALKFVAGMTLTMADDTPVIHFVSTSATVQTIDTAGKTVKGAIQFNGNGGSWQLSSALTMSAAGLLQVNRGTFDANDQNISAFSFSSGGALVRTTVMGTGTWTATGATGGWSISGSNVTVTCETSTIAITDAGASDKTFAGAGKTYNNLLITTGGAGLVNITGSNTFAGIAVTGGGTKTITFEVASTTTMTGALPSGASGQLITLKSSADLSAWNLSRAAGTMAISYVSLRDSAAAGGATFNATDSTDVSGNTGWNFVVGGGGTANPFAGKFGVLLTGKI